MRRVKSFSAGNEFAQIELEDGTRWRIRRGDDWDVPCPGDASDTARATKIIGLECHVQLLKDELKRVKKQSDDLREWNNRLEKQRNAMIRAKDEQCKRAGHAERELRAAEFRLATESRLAKSPHITEGNLWQVWEAIRDLARSAVTDCPDDSREYERYLRWKMTCAHVRAKAEVIVGRGE